MSFLENLPRQVEIIEVGLRDGLQREQTHIPVEEKAALVDDLVRAGLKRIQVTSFVHPRAVPQMADAEELCARLTAYPGVIYSGLALNRKGVKRAYHAGLQHIDISVSASDSHSRRNANLSMEEAMAEFDEMFALAGSLEMTIRGGIQCAFGYQMPGDVDPQTVVGIARHYVELGVGELALADSSGLANPRQLAALLDLLLTIAGDTPLILHLHDTRGMGLANVLTALKIGVRSFDTAFGGLGGCPFIDGATGNIATEDTVHMLAAMGIETGVDLLQLAAISRRFEQRLGKASLPGKLYALLTPEAVGGGE